MVFSLLDDHHVARRIFAYDKPRLARSADPHPFALADRVERDPVVLADHFPLKVLKVPLLVAEILARELFKVTLTDEADAGAVFFL